MIVNESVSSSTTTQNTSSQTTEPEDVFIENSNYGVANAKPGDKLKREDETIVVITQGDIDWAKAQLEKNTTNSESTKTDTELNEIIGVGSCGGACGRTSLPLPSVPLSS